MQIPLQWQGRSIKQRAKEMQINEIEEKICSIQDNIENFKKELINSLDYYDFGAHSSCELCVKIQLEKQLLKYLYSFLELKKSGYEISIQDFIKEPLELCQEIALHSDDSFRRITYRRIYLRLEDFQKSFK